MKKRIIVINLKEFFHIGIDRPFAILSELERVVYNLDNHTDAISIEYMNGIFEFVFQELRIDKNGLIIVKYKVNI